MNQHTCYSRYDHCPATQHPSEQLTQQFLEAEMKSTQARGGEVHFRGGWDWYQFPLQKEIKKPQGRDSCAVMMIAFIS